MRAAIGTQCSLLTLCWIMKFSGSGVLVFCVSEARGDTPRGSPHPGRCWRISLSWPPANTVMCELWLYLCCFLHAACTTPDSLLPNLISAYDLGFETFLQHFWSITQAENWKNKAFYCSVAQPFLWMCVFMEVECRNLYKVGQSSNLRLSLTLMFRLILRQEWTFRGCMFGDHARAASCCSRKKEVCFLHNREHLLVFVRLHKRFCRCMQSCFAGMGCQWLFFVSFSVLNAFSIKAWSVICISQ